MSVPIPSRKYGAAKAGLSAVKTINRWFSQWFVLVAGGIFFFTGLSKLISPLGGAPFPQIQDPIFGVPWGHVMMTLGVIESAVGAVCLLTSARRFSLGLIAWMTANLIVYRIGLWHLGWHRLACPGTLIDALKLSSKTVDMAASVTSVCLLAGSCVLFWKLPRAASGYFKIPCQQCGGHIEFPAGGVGRKIACPHCSATITLQLPQRC